MKAAQINDYGDASVIQINNPDTPIPGDDQILVEVHASSLNPFDTSVRTGYMKEAIPLQFPATLGGDIAGVVVQIGQSVKNFKVGDKVFGQASVVAKNSGAFAEYAATSSSQVARMPENLDFKQAASVTLVGVSALQALVQYIHLQPGQKIFIHGGSGGIGTIAIQIAKSIGAYVTTTATGNNIEFVKKLGADEVIDYKTQDFSQILSDYDAVYDTVGGDDFNKSLTILKKGGTAVSMKARADESKVSELGITAITQATKVNTEVLNQLRKLLESGAITPQVEKVYPLSQVREAFEAREGGSVRGKIVIAVR